MKHLHLSRLFILSLVFIASSGMNILAAAEEHTPLGEQMEQIGQAWRTVKRSAADASKNAQTLELVKKMLAAARASQDYTPAMLEDIPDAGREKFLTGYARGMKTFAANLEKLAQLLESGDNAGATELISRIDNQREKAHQAFKRPE